MRIRHLITCVMLTLAVATPAAANRLIAANSPVQIAGSALTVTPAQDWNRLSARPGRGAEIWTLDGDALNNISFYGGIENDRPLFREVDRRNRPLPRFSATMLLADIPTLVENSYRVGRSVGIFTAENVEPVQFANRDGLRFTYSFAGPDEVRRRGEAYGTIVDGRLFLVTFEAPSIHFFDASLGSFRQIVGTASLAPAERARR